MADKCWIVYGFLGGLGCPALRFNYYNGTSWVFDKTKYRAHLTAIADAGANALRRMPDAGARDNHPYGKKGQFCEYQYVSESVGWDLDHFNEAYFDTLGEAILIENDLGLTTFQCFADNAVYHRATSKIYSPWVSNNNGIDTVYDADAYPYFDALIDKYLSEFSSMDVVWAVGNEMDNSGFPALFNAVIHPLVDAATLDPDKLTYGSCSSSITNTVRGYLADEATRNKVIMEVHGWPASVYKSRFSPWNDTGARMLFSDDGVSTGASTCDKWEAGAAPSAAEWYDAVLDVLETYGAADGSDDHILNFEHTFMSGYDLSTACQAATIAKIREAYEVWVATTTSPPLPPPDTVPVAPSNLTVTISGATTATLAWTDNSINELDFHIEKSTTAPGITGFAEIATVAADVVTYGATGLTEGASVWFRVRAHNAAGYSGYTAIVLAVVPSAVSTAKPARRLANLPYPFGFKSLDEVRDYLIKLRSKLVMADFTINLGDIINPSGNPFVFPMDGVLYEMLKCDEEVLSWGWREGLGGNTFLGLDVIAGGDATGGNDTYLGYQAGYHSTTASANVSVGSGSGTFLRTTYTIDPNVDYQFALRKTASTNNIYSLFKFKDYLLAKELNTDGGSHYHFLKSTDGINWNYWFDIPDFHQEGACCCIEFSNKLYINWFAPSGTKLYVWDGNTLTTKLTSTLAQENNLVGPMYVFDSKLWFVTDVTPSLNDRRVAYWTADGTTYNAVTNYDGVAYIPYNTAYAPTVGASYSGRFLCNRWFEFKGILYLLASTYNTTNANWSWQIWQAGTTAFTKVYDSSVLNDDYGISSVVTDGNFVIITANIIASNGDYGDDCRVYRSTNMTAWDIVATLADQGLCCESKEYGNIFYSMFLITEEPSYYVKLYYWDDENLEYVQCGSTITTNPHLESGNFIEYNGSFFVGKWKEIYELERVKSPSVTVTSGTASGNTIVGASAGDAPISGSLDCLYGYNSNLSLPEIENGIAIGAYSRVSRDNTLVLGGTDTYQVDVAIGQTYAIGRLHVHQYGEKEIDTYGLYIDNIATNTALDGINKYGLYVTSTGEFTGSTGTGTKNYGFYLPAVTGADTNYGFYSVSNVTTEDQFISSLAIGTKPLDVTSTTVCTNLNADLLDGSHSSAFLTSVTAHNLLSATHGDTTAGTVVLGDVIYGDAATKWVKLAGNITTAKQYLSQTGTSAISAVPAWATIAQADITGLKTADGPSFEHLHLTIADGTAPLVITSTTEVANLNVHLLQGNHASAFEPALGNPGTSGFILSSTDAGVRSWVAAGGAMALDDLTDVDVTTPSDNDIIRYDSGSSTWQHEPLPAGGAHDILSATHADTAAVAVTRGDIIIGSVAAPNTKWTALALGAAGTYLAGSATEPSWATLNQAAVDGLKTTDSPSFDHLHLTIADGTAPIVVTSSTEVANLNVHLLQGNHASAFEPALGNPATTGFVLSSTDAGVRSWTSAGGGGSVSKTTITATGATNWNKVSGATWCLVRLWAGGGSGARVASGNAGGGGGGGAYIEKIFDYADLSDPVSVTIGAGGATVTVDNTVGNVGGNTTFGAYLTVYGGGGGSKDSTLFGGGGGGGTKSVGLVGSASAGGAGGGPGGGVGGSGSTTATASGNSGFGGGGGGCASTAGITIGGGSGWGGGGGGGGTATNGNSAGGDSLYGGGGGGGGSDTGAGSAGGTSVFGGAGGAGATEPTAATAGTQPAGGGGGSEAANSGAGGDGKAIIISFA